MLDLIAVFLWLVPAYTLAGVVSIFIETEMAPTPWRGKEFSDVKSWLAILLRRGYQGGHILIAHGPSGRSLRFRKYIRDKGDYGLELCFPNTDWAAEYRPMIQDFCKKAGRHYRVETETLDGSTNEVLLIDCEQETDRAYDLALAIWTRFFDLPARGWYEREGHGIAVRDELIEDPDLTRPSKQEIGEQQWDKARKDLRDRAGISPGGALYASGLLILGLIAIVGLPIATVISIGDPPSWSVDAGILAVGGSTTSLIFFLMYMLVGGALLRFIKGMKKTWGKSTVYETVYGEGLRFVVIALPIAVILVWTGA